LTAFRRSILMFASSLFMFLVYCCNNNNTPCGIKFACPTIADED
jgi:hypothetical protein